MPLVQIMTPLLLPRLPVRLLAGWTTWTAQRPASPVTRQSAPRSALLTRLPVLLVPLLLQFPAPLRPFLALHLLPRVLPLLHHLQPWSPLTPPVLLVPLLQPAILPLHPAPRPLPPVRRVPLTRLPRLLPVPLVRLPPHG